MDITKAIESQKAITDHLQKLHSALCKDNPLGAEFVRKYLEKSAEIESALNYIKAVE